jgi:hypothetical protein
MMLTATWLEAEVAADDLFMISVVPAPAEVARIPMVAGVSIRPVWIAL